MFVLDLPCSVKLVEQASFTLHSNFGILQTKHVGDDAVFPIDEVKNFLKKRRPGLGLNRTDTRNTTPTLTRRHGNNLKNE